MVSKERKSSMHPIFKDLGLLETQTPHKATNVPIVSSLDVLQYFLENRILREDSIRSAVQALSQPPGQGKPSEISPNEAKATSGTTSNTPTTNTPPLGKVNPLHRTRHIALRFFYDGANFNGLAQNVGQGSDNSVEKVLFQALMRARLVESRETSGYSRCGRTDRGVSAAGQVVALHLKSAIPIDASLDPEGKKRVVCDGDDSDDPAQQCLPKNEFEKISVWVVPRQRNNSDNQTTRVNKELSEYPYAKILNNILPPEIRILGWAPVSQEFSARFSATTRTYRYFFVRRQLQLQPMQKGLSLLIGKHDFRNFCKMDVEKVYNFERVIHDAQLLVKNDDTNEYIPISHGDPASTDASSSSSSSSSQQQLCYVEIHGQAFLWHQIRCIMEVLFLIGNQLEDPSIVTELLNVEKYPGKPAYPLAPEKPLVLTDCGYPNLQMGYSVSNVWAVSCQLEQQWEEHVLAAARIRNGIDVFRSVPIRRDELLQFAVSKISERNRKLKKFGLATHDFDEAAKLSQTLPSGSATSLSISWADANHWLQKYCNLIPDSKGLDTSIHIPLLKRSRGTTYEEKVEAIQKSDRRRQKYEGNVIKKRKTAEEDAAFYNHMIQQGGTGM